MIDEAEQQIEALVREALAVADAAALTDTALHLDRVLVALGRQDDADMDALLNRDAA